MCLGFNELRNLKNSKNFDESLNVIQVCHTPLNFLIVSLFLATNSSICIIPLRVSIHSGIEGAVEDFQYLGINCLTAE